jgi:hypothetical protein
MVSFTSALLLVFSRAPLRLLPQRGDVEEEFFPCPLQTALLLGKMYEYRNH